jgi:hypothetical protein
MVINFAWDHIEQGSTFEERQNRLKIACTAWNYACVPEQVGMEQLGNYMVEYQKWHPDADVEECRALREDMELLIQEKRKKFPHVIKQIISCELMWPSAPFCRGRSLTFLCWREEEVAGSRQDSGLICLGVIGS